MNFKFIKKRLVIVTVAVAMLIPTGHLVAAEATGFTEIVKQEKQSRLDANCLVNAVAEIQKESNTEKTIKIQSTEEIQFQNKVSGKVFVKVEGEYQEVVEVPEEGSAILGKVFANSVVKITERGEVWSKIETGNLAGYVKTVDLISGKDAISYVQTLLEESYPESDTLTLSQDEIEAVLSVGETLEEESQRLAKEEAERVAAEQIRIAQEKEASRKKGQEIVEYAKRFIGNPYVYGGTSLTRGTDCSGFVKGVYKNFGIQLPRTSYEMRKVGRAVSYSEMQPGDIVCYSGHVGIYAGNGKIVNAINERKGINLSNVTYKSIITIRRIF